LAAERERWVLWLPAFFAAGIGLYFLLPSEPPPWSGAIAALLLLGPLAVQRRRPWLRLLLGLLLAVALGFGAAQWRAQQVAAPFLVERLGPVAIEARLQLAEPVEGGWRLTLSPLAIEGLRPEELPRLVRVRQLKPLPEAALPGVVVRLTATLLPPPQPSLPGDFDFAREAWFRGLGAVGFTFGEAELVEGAAAASGWELWWSRQRSRLSERVRAVLTGDVGGVADALLTGQRGAISEATAQAYRDSGLAHLLSISGLHVGLIAAILFFSLRALLALVPPLALRFPIKKWAAVVALLALPPYMLLVAASVPTQRATFTAMVVLLAVLLDRRAISLRLVAWAAVLVLAIAPEALLGPSFQMSFAAVTALVAGYEAWARRTPRDDGGPFERVLVYAGGVLLSSVIATAATAPFAAFHFDRLALYGLVANLVAVPLTAFWIMPGCLGVYLLLPFGLEDWALTLLGWGVGVVNWVALETASWPAAALLLPAMPLWGLLAATLGGLWLCLWVGRWRLAGLALLLAGAVSPALQRPPDLLISGDARVIGLADPAGELWLSTGRAARFTSDAWLARRGAAEALVWWPRLAQLGSWLTCDSQACRYRRAGRQVALVFAGEALLEECWGNDLVVATLPIRSACPRGTAALDRFDLWREGSHAVWLEPEGIVVRSVAETRGDRPWSPRRTGDAVALPGDEGAAAED